MAIVTHKCQAVIVNNYHEEDTYQCKAVRFSDGKVKYTCGEPCSWIMGKSGHGNPPWTATSKGYRCNPHVADGEEDAPGT